MEVTLPPTAYVKNVKFCAIEDGPDGTSLFCFYREKEDIGKPEKRFCSISFFDLDDVFAFFDKAIISMKQYQQMMMKERWK